MYQMGFLVLPVRTQGPWMNGSLNFSGFDGQSLKCGVTAILAHGYYSYLGLLERSLRFSYGKAPFESNSSHKCIL